MTRRHSLFGTVLLILLATTAIVVALALPRDRVTAVTGAVSEASGPSCRWGVSAHGESQVEWVDDLGAGWFVFFGGYSDAAGEDVQIAPVISVKQDKDGDKYLDSYKINPDLDSLSLLLEHYPGTLWIVGNEVDRGPGPGQTIGQGDTFPDVYARAYNEVYHFIKQHDSTALVANSGLVQVTPGRLQYLDLMWESYQDQFGEPMPVDVWNMHIYVLPEANLDGTPNGIANIALGTDPSLAKRGPGINGAQCLQEDIYCYAEHDNVDIFEDQARAMRRWMFEHGQSKKPLILSEFSILYPCDDPNGLDCDYLRDEFGNDFDKQRVQNYLDATTTWLQNATDWIIGNPLDGGRLVQQWTWFSISATTMVGDVSDLVRSDGGSLVGLTDLGWRYRNKAINAPIYLNLTLAPLIPVVAETSGNGSVDVMLSAEVGNSGSIEHRAGFSVTFYADSGLTQVIGQAQVPAPAADEPGLRGCATGKVDVSTTWSGLSSGLHPFWVKIAGQGAGPEDVAKGFVLVDPEHAWFPIFRRE